MPGVQLFSDTKFFVLQRTPARSSLILDIERHGGRLVKLEQQADYVIADHLRKDTPTGAVSYRFIEEAVKTNTVPEVEQFRISHATVPVHRPVGSFSAPTRSIRTPYTAEDDRELYLHVKKYEAQGLAVKGNELYKMLATLNPRHTYQSWRERYIKVLINKPPAGIDVSALSQAPITPSQRPVPRTKPVSTQRGLPSPHTSSEGEQANLRPSEQTPTKRTVLPLSKEDLDLLIDNADTIEEIPMKNWQLAWEAWAGKYGRHSWEQWADHYTKTARAEYLRRSKAQAAEAVDMVRDFEVHEQLDGVTYSRAGRANSLEVEGQENRPALKKNMVGEQSPLHRPESSKRPLEERSPEPRKRQRGENTPKVPVARREFRLPNIINVEAAKPPTPQEIAVIAEHQERRVLQPSIPQFHSPDRLTQENLEHMQAEQRRSSTRRAFDLSQDDENADQSAFIEDLQHILGRTADFVGPNASWDDVEEIPETEFGDEGQIQKRTFSLSPIRSEELGASPEPETVQRKKDKSLVSRLEDKSEVRQNVPAQSSLAAPRHEPKTKQPVAPPRRATGSRNAFAAAPPARHVSNIPSSSPVQPSFRGARADQGLDGSDVDGTIFLDLPEPEDGFFNQMSSMPSEPLLFRDDDGRPRLSIESDKVFGVDAQKALAAAQRDTQAIFAADTQEIDYDLPALDEPFTVDPLSPTTSFDRPEISRRISSYLRDDARSASPPPPSSDTEDIEVYISRQTAAGHDEEHVVRALEATCMQVRLAAVALEFLSKGKGLPRSISGVWTEDEDVALEGGDAGERRALGRKHGLRELERRADFLKSLRG